MMKRKGTSVFWGASVIAVFILGYSMAAPVQDQTDNSAETSAYKILNEVDTIRTADASTLKNDLGSITYGIDDHAINVILDLDLPRHPQVGIAFIGADSQGVVFGDMTSNLKVGHVEQETTFFTENNRLVLWTQVPVRSLGDGNEAWIELTDQKTGTMILKQKLTFPFNHPES
ncbi:hypothetical protein GRF59_02220 [Paenibacillus sp. HJL G12]|uniref:Uncharacterized protein n=1 Tax=Paenibacillus dendrobii TaxID=2691084 RepID=A0A7X3IFN0_9BACL|nr:hypothetical protein [Paenibacillus dendrobii]MWV42436.1 hypothetical protein [Paenibacillus dendrobii]